MKGPAAPRRTRRGQLLALAGLTVALSAAFAGPGRAAPQIPGGEERPPQGMLVEAIEVHGNERIPDDTVRFYMATRVGAPFDWTTARQDFRALLNSGLFDNLAMRWRPGEAGGVVVVVEVVERPLLRKVRIEGTEKVTPDDFLERMEVLEMPVEEDAPLDEQRLRRGREVLMTMLQGEEGLQFVQVRLDIVPSAVGAGVDAVYRVVEGAEVRIAQVNFEGATVFTQRELRWHAKRTGEHWLLSFLTKNDRFSWAGFEQDMERIRRLYLAHGYLDFSYAEPEIEVYDVDRPLFLDPTRRLFVTIPINEGPQYRVGRVSVEGNQHFSDQELLAMLPLRPGDVFDVEQVMAARDAMQAAYSNAGYFEINVFPIPDRDPEGGVADLIFRVEENDLYFVRRIEFEGNTHTRDYVLRRNLRLHETDRWDQSRFQKSLFKIYQLGYFQDLKPEIITVPRRRPADDGAGEARPAAGEGVGVEGTGEPGVGELDIKIKVQEVGRNQVTFSGGASALEGAFVGFGYTTRNLFGKGQTLSFFGQFGARRTNARISFFEPYLLGKPVRFGLDLFRDSLDFFDFNREGTGLSTRVGFPLDEEEFLTIFAEYNYEFIDIGEISGGFLSLTSPLFRALFFEEGKRTTSSVRPFVRWDSIDNPFNPSRGSRTLASVEVAGGVLGGTLDFWKAIVQTNWYMPTVTEGAGLIGSVKQIFAWNLEVRFASPYGDLEELPIFERFFLGGSQSIRGTRLRAVGPRDERGNILGGDKALQYNLEYIFQLADPLRLVLFHDAGQAWAPGETPRFGDLRKTAGVEFRVFAPVFNVPFRFFWAYNFDPIEALGEERSTFEFAIGTVF